MHWSPPVTAGSREGKENLKVKETFIPYCVPYWTEAEIEGIADTIRSNWWSKGPKTVEFEEKFADYVGAKYTVAMNSCTAALHIALLTYGIGAGDEVITTPMTFCSTANVIVHTGATPVFCDIDTRTGLMDADTIEPKITAKTKAIIPVHYAGQACDMDRINAIAQKHGLKVIEDAAHAVYTTYKGQMIGSSPNPTAFSFYATKNLSTGEGGMLTCPDEEFLSRARMLSLHGMSRGAWSRYHQSGSWKYDVQEAGFKYNMTDMQASLGLAQLEKLEHMQSIRERYAEMYHQAFEGLAGLTPLGCAGQGRCAWHLYVLLVNADKLTIGRDQFVDELADRNIGVSVHFIPVHLHPFYKEHYGTKEGDCPKAEAMYEKIFSLPLYPAMSEDDVNYVAETVRYLHGKYAK